MRAIICLESIIAPALCNPDSILLFVEDLLQIKNDLNNSSNPPLLEENISEKLISLDLYPCDHIFAKNLSKSKEIIYSARDIARIVNNIISNQETWSSELPDVASEWSDTHITPDINPFSSREPQLKEMLEAITIHHHNSNFHASIINPKLSASTHEINFTGTLNDISPDLIDNLPKTLSSNTPVTSRYLEYFPTANIEIFFKNAKSDYDIKLAIYIGCIKSLESRNISDHNFTLDSFELGQDFTESLRRNQCYFEQKFFGVCIEKIINILTENTNTEAKPFRLNETSTEQRRNGEYYAWRTHVTKKHEALRLMFWKDREDHIILANVGNKHELEISP